jgi:predicted ester cyclase
MNQLEINKAIVRRFNKEFLEEGDEDVALDLVDPDFINHTAPAGTPRGGEGLIYFVNKVMRQAFPDLRVEIYQQIAENDLVFTRKTFHATHLGPFMGIAPTGRKVFMNVMDIIRIKNGKYIEHWGIRDTQELLNQLK